MRCPVLLASTLVTLATVCGPALAGALDPHDPPIVIRSAPLPMDGDIVNSETTHLRIAPVGPVVDRNAPQDPDEVGSQAPVQSRGMASRHARQAHPDQMQALSVPRSQHTSQRVGRIERTDRLAMRPVHVSVGPALKSHPGPASTTTPVAYDPAQANQSSPVPPALAGNDGQPGSSGDGDGHGVGIASFEPPEQSQWTPGARQAVHQAPDPASPVVDMLDAGHKVSLLGKVSGHGQGWYALGIGPRLGYVRIADLASSTLVQVSTPGMQANQGHQGHQGHQDHDAGCAIVGPGGADLPAHPPAYSLQSRADTRAADLPLQY